MDQYSHEHLTYYTYPSSFCDSLPYPLTPNAESSGTPPSPFDMSMELMYPDYPPSPDSPLSSSCSPTFYYELSENYTSFVDGALQSQEVFNSQYGSTHPFSDTLQLVIEDQSLCLTNCNTYDAHDLSLPSTIPFRSDSFQPDAMPLTVSPQLLHSPASYHCATPLATSGELQYPDGFNMITEANITYPAEKHSISSPLPTQRRRTRTSAHKPITPHRPSRSSRYTKHSASSSIVRDIATDDEHVIRTRARRSKGKGTPNYNSVNESGDFCCETCGYVCKPSRKVDFRRHVNTHYPKMVNGPVICCGVPVEQRNDSRWKIPASAPIMTFYGRQMVGGCGRIFSRTDALKRHLELRGHRCVGDLKGEWHPQKQ